MVWFRFLCCGHFGLRMYDIRKKSTNKIFSNIRSCHYDDVIMTTMASQITSLAIVYSTVYSDADQRKHQSSASLAFVRGIHRWPVNSPHKWPVSRKMFPFDDVIMYAMPICSGNSWSKSWVSLWIDKRHRLIGIFKYSLWPFPCINHVANVVYA